MYEGGEQKWGVHNFFFLVGFFLGFVVVVFFSFSFDGKGISASRFPYLAPPSYLIHEPRGEKGVRGRQGWREQVQGCLNGKRATLKNGNGGWWGGVGVGG